MNQSSHQKKILSVGNATASLLADYYRCCDSPEECKREETLEKGAGKWIALSEHPKFTGNATQGRTKQVPILASIKHTLEKRFKLNALHTFGEGSSSATSFNATYDFDTYWKTAKKTAGSGYLDTILGILTEAPFKGSLLKAPIKTKYLHLLSAKFRKATTKKEQ